jgi:hypothetical protein
MALLSVDVGDGGTRFNASKKLLCDTTEAALIVVELLLATDRVIHCAARARPTLHRSEYVLR